jgi:hypothetical protein
MFGNFFPVSISSTSLNKCSNDSNKFLQCMTQIDVIHKANCNIYLDDFLKCLRKNNQNEKNN